MKDSIELKASSPAPWAGVLMDPNRVIRLGLRVQALRQLRWLDLKAADERKLSERELTKQLSAADMKLLTSERDAYRKHSQELQRTIDKLGKWYRSWAFGFAVGVVSASATAVVLVLAR